MARHGENIRKRTDGRWEGRYPVYREAKGQKVYRSVYGKSYQEVKGKLEAARGQDGMVQRTVPGNGVRPGQSILAESRTKQEGNSVSRMEAAPEWGAEPEVGIQEPCIVEKYLFTEVAAQWLIRVKNTKKLSTYVKYRLVFRQHLEKPFGNMELTRITDQMVCQQISGQVTDSVRKSIYCVLNQILLFGSRQYGIPLPVLKRPEDKGNRKPVGTFSRTEQRKLFSVLLCGNDLFKSAVLLCLYTGLRLGEVCALKWEDVDPASRVIMVNRAVQRLYMEGFRTKTVLWETGPKSQHSRREIPISDAVMNLLARLQDERGPGKEENQYIFGGKKPVEPRTMQNHFKKILKEAGLEGRNFHTLRHTFATNCIEGGTDVKSLSELLGHSDVQITLNRYVHPSMDTKRKHLDVLSSFYEQMDGPVCGQIYGQAG